MDWRLKGSIQRGLSLLPGGCRCNHFLQRTVGLLRNEQQLHHTFEQDVPVLFARIARTGVRPPGARILEIGTGWLPLFPLSLALAGFRNVVTVDLTPHLREPLVRRTLLAMAPHLMHPCFRPFATQDEVLARYDQMLRSSNILTTAGISYFAPCNAAATGLQPGSLDLIVSNNVFEHIPSGVLGDIFQESRRLLRPGGHILHCINCGDHYAYADSSISQLNYLRYSEQQWAAWNNPLHYQNRLRPIDFGTMADDRGFEIRELEMFTPEKNLRALESMEIAPEFRHYSLQQLASTSATLMATVH